MNKELTTEEIEKILSIQNNFFETQTTKNINFRIEQLQKLKTGIKKYEEKISNALYMDLGKHKDESYMTEVGFVYHSISDTIKNLKKMG